MKKYFSFVIIILIFGGFKTHAQQFRIGIAHGFEKNIKQINLEMGFAIIPKREFGIYANGWEKLNRTDINNTIITDIIGKVDNYMRFGFQGKQYFGNNKFKFFTGLQMGTSFEEQIKIVINKTGTIYNYKDFNNNFEMAPLAGLKYGPLNVFALYGTGQMGFKMNVGLLFSIGKFEK